jgi:hypothetical protein
VVAAGARPGLSRDPRRGGPRAGAAAPSANGSGLCVCRCGRRGARRGNDGLLVRTGWAGQAEDAPLQAQREPAPGQVARAAVPASGSADFAELDRRLRGIEAALASQADTSGTQLAGSAITGMSDAEMLRQVRRIVSEAEARQETAVAVRLLQLVNDFDQKRRTDIALLQQGLDQYQGMTNAEIAQSRDLFNRWIRAAARQEK